MTVHIYNYALKYLNNSDGIQPKAYSTEIEPYTGDVIELDSGDYHCVVKINRLKATNQLILSEPATTHEEAFRLASQSGHLSEM
ncbi:MAG: hypothetical protein OFPI_26380 [Osedax symbiont Rs2]|nr:MAG: hypothetical protein OFPI_26380 [Osedax symbiont Rs2]